MYGVRFFALEIAFSEHRDAKVLEKLVNSFNFLKRLYRFHTNYFSETRLFFSISRIKGVLLRLYADHCSVLVPE